MRNPVHRQEYRWARYEDERLLRLKFSSLRLRLRDSLVWPDVQRIYQELSRRGFSFRPHVWLAEDWFSPDAAPGIAIPFYVAHERLRRLERSMMGEVEGGTRLWRLRILRHEAGHAIDTAYGLRRRADWRRVFGPGSSRYPLDYSPQPGSRDHVLHIGHWYAQSHPTEDFAETFAVWMQPKARWQRTYAQWPALAKLEFVDALMGEIREVTPLCRNRRVYDSLARSDLTLGEYYRQKLRRRRHADTRYDTWILQVFALRGHGDDGVSAGHYVRSMTPRLLRLLAGGSGVHAYLIEHAVAGLVRRVRELDLVVADSRGETGRRLVRLVEQIVADILQRDQENFAL